MNWKVDFKSRGGHRVGGMRGEEDKANTRYVHAPINQNKSV